MRSSWKKIFILAISLLLALLMLSLACSPKAPSVETVDYARGGVVIGTHYYGGETEVTLANSTVIHVKGDMRLILGGEYTFYFYDDNWHVGVCIDELPKAKE